MTKEEIQKIYDRMKSLSLKEIGREKCHHSLACLRAAGYIAYSFGLKYCDDDIEGQLVSLSTQIKRRDNVSGGQKNGMRCVFLDGLSEFRGGLTVQYLRAIKEAGWETLYVSDQDLGQRHRISLVKELKSNPQLRYVQVPKRTSGQGRCQFMYDAIMDFAPDFVIVHIPPYDSYAATVCYALPSTIKKYMVNYTDHSFLLGTGCMDYSLEFRSKGASISKVFRHIEETQMFMLPYYAFSEDEKPYQGLPKICDGKVVIFTGGNYWKIIDEEDTYFKLSKRILEECPNAVIVLAGRGNDEVVRKAVERQQPGERFVVLGWRQDIGALFEHSDIYLSTYPYPGGLMGQFAARAGKPILAYDPQNKRGTESLTCQTKMVDISITEMDDFIAETKRLVNDTDYRKQKGDELRDSVLSIGQFNRMLREVVESQKPTGLPIEIDEKVQEPSEEYIQNNIKTHGDGHSCKSTLVSYLGTYSLSVLPWSYIVTYYKTRIPQWWSVAVKRCIKK